MIRLIIFFLLSMLLSACPESKGLTDSEIAIVAKNEVEKLYAFQAYILSNRNNSNEESELLEVINTLSNDVISNQNLDSSRSLVAEYVSRYVEKPGEQDQQISFNHIQTNLSAFKNKQLSLVEDFEFVDQLLDYYYWSTWKCDLNDHSTLRVSGLDTLILFRNEEYEFEVGTQFDNYSILSNTLQGVDQNHIRLKPENLKENGNITFMTELINNTTKEKLIRSDTVYIILVDRPN